MSEAQSAATVVMVRPHNFAGNPETLGSNSFQSTGPSNRATAADASAEFDALATALQRHGVEAHTFDGRTAGDAPDEVFPNNWFSTHADGTLVLYPMMAPSRRRERRADIADALETGCNRVVKRIVDLSPLERHGEFLEGTGSLVLDRAARVAFACRSARTTAGALAAFRERLDHEVVEFRAFGVDGRPIYHTNVMLSLGTEFAIVCSASICASDRDRVVARIAEHRRVVDITPAQVECFAGNVLELVGRAGRIVVISAAAYAALEPFQRRLLERFADLVVTDISTIERYGGGSVRCMLAEVFLPGGAPSASR